MSIKGDRGSLIFPMLIAMMIMVLSIVNFYQSAYLVRKMEDQRMLAVGSLKALNVSLRSLLNSPVAFMSSAQLPENGDFWSCLNDPNFDCKVATEQNFHLLNEDGTRYIDMGPNQGFSRAFTRCDTYPSSDCPFRYELKWHRECLNLGPCYSPDLFVRGELFVGDRGIKNTINPDNFKILIKVR